MAGQQVDYAGTVNRKQTVDFILPSLPAQYAFAVLYLILPQVHFHRVICVKSSCHLSVTNIYMGSIYVYAVNPNDVSIENIPPSLIKIGMYFEYGGVTWEWNKLPII